MRKTLLCLVVALCLMLSSSAFAIFDVPEQYDMPIVTDGSVKLSVYMAMEKGSETAMLTYDEHSAIIEWEARTGVDFTFVHPPENDDGTYFNMVIASGDFPDVWVTGNWNTYYPGGVEGAIEDGILEDLNPYVEKLGYYYLTEAHTNWDAGAEKNFMTDNGMYRFGAASQRVPVLGMQHNGFGVRSDVLEELGLEVPRTITEFTEMLRAFKEYGFEVPLAMGKWGRSYCFNDGMLNGFLGIKTGDSNQYMLNDEGKVTHAYIEPGFKDFLILLSGWMEEGLIDRDFISREHSDEKTMLTSGKSAVTAYGNWETQELITLSGVNSEGAYLVGIPAIAPDGEADTFKNPYGSPIINGSNTMYWGISTTCKEKEVAFKALDYLYSYDGTELMVFGCEKNGRQRHPLDERGRHPRVLRLHTEEPGSRVQLHPLRLHHPEPVERILLRDGIHAVRRGLQRPALGCLDLQHHR